MRAVHAAERFISKILVPGTLARCPFRGRPAKITRMAITGNLPQGQTLVICCTSAHRPQTRNVHIIMQTHRECKLFFEKTAIFLIIYKNGHAAGCFIAVFALFHVLIV